jgi:hypothetical protein
MIDFGVLDRAAAQAYCDAYAYAAAVPERVRWLRSAVLRTGGPANAVDGSPGSLDPLWTWAWQRLREPGGPVVDLPGRPPWYSPDRPSRYLSDGALWIIDALGCYLAALAQQAIPAAEWAVYRMPKKYKDIDQNRAMLFGLPRERPADPARMVYGDVIGTVIHGEPVDPLSLRRLYVSLVPTAP